MLRRLKADVEAQMPKKYEHIVPCQLSRRQRFLYDDFMSQTKTKDSLSSGNYMNIINILMQLRKCCNHPNLFAEPLVETPFVASPLTVVYPSLVFRDLEQEPRSRLRRAELVSFDSVDLNFMNLCLIHYECSSLVSQSSSEVAAVNTKILDLSLPVSDVDFG